MKAKITASIVIMLLFGLTVRAQLLDAALVKNYPPGVVSKVFEVVKHTPLSKQQQYELAMRYQQIDNTVAQWLIEGRSVKEIDSLQNSANVILYAILDEKQRASHALNVSKQFAAMTSEGELQYLQQEYKPDSAALVQLGIWLNQRYSYMYQAFLWAQSNPAMLKHINNDLAKTYDLFAFYPTLYSKKYMEGYFDKLKAIKPVPDAVLQKIKMSFYSKIKEDKYTDWSKALTDLTLYYLPDTAYYSKLRYDDLTREANRLSATDRNNLLHQQHISKVAYETVYPMVQQKNFKNALLEYTYATYSPKKCDSLISKNTHYYDSTIEATLILNGGLQPSTQFAIALRYKNDLKLHPQLTDSLLHHAMYLSAVRDSIISTDPFAMIDFGIYEAEKLNKLLTEEQYTLLLGIMNRHRAIADAENDWREMGVRDLQKNLNKDQVIQEIANYYMSKYISWNRYANDKIEQWAAINALENTKPYALKILDPIRWSGSTVRSTNNLKLKW